MHGPGLVVEMVPLADGKVVLVTGEDVEFSLLD